MISILEELSELEHEQWLSWIHSVIVRLEKAIDTSNKLPIGNNFLECEIKTMIKNWDVNRIPYCELSEEVKELDRIWARKVLKVIDSEVF